MYVLFSLAALATVATGQFSPNTNWWTKDFNDPRLSGSPLETYSGLTYNRPPGGINPTTLNALSPVLRNGYYPLEFPAQQLTPQQMDAITRYHQQRVALANQRGQQVGITSPFVGQGGNPINPNAPTNQKLDIITIIRKLNEKEGGILAAAGTLEGDDKLQLVKYLNGLKAASEAGEDPPKPTPEQQKVFERIVQSNPDLINEFNPLGKRKRRSVAPHNLALRGSLTLRTLMQ